MADYSIAASAAAKKGTEELRNQMLNILNTNYANQQEVARSETDKLLNQLANQATQYQSNYETDARQNYVSSVLGKNTISDQLKRLGLYNSGYGVSQLGAIDANAATNLTTLKNALNENLRNIDLAKNEAQTDLSNTLLNLSTQYNEDSLANEQYLNNLYNTLYSNEYDRLFNEAKQEEATRQFNEELAEKIRQYNASLAEEQRQYNLNLAEEQRQSNASLALQKQQYEDSIAQALGYTTKEEQTTQENNYNTLLSTINKSYGFATENDLADKYEELEALIDNTNISETQKTKLKNALDTAVKKWSINKTNVKGTSSTPSLSSSGSTKYNSTSNKSSSLKDSLLKYSPISR